MNSINKQNELINNLINAAAKLSLSSYGAMRFAGMERKDALAQVSSILHDLLGNMLSSCPEELLDKMDACCKQADYLDIVSQTVEGGFQEAEKKMQEG